MPESPSYYASVNINFKKDYEQFTDKSRTYGILEMLEERSSLEVRKAAGELLPSTNLLVGYEIDGENWNITSRDSLFFTGISVDWPLPGQVARANRKLAEINRRETGLVSENKYHELYTNLRNLYLSIEREKELISTGDKKIKLSEAILEDEAENYSFGKVTLNDYIDAVNRLDQNKISRLSHLIQYKILVIEWLRLTDRLLS